MFSFILYHLLRFILTFRYKVKTIGLDFLNEKLDKEKGILFLANHPAEIDPPILLALLWKKYKPHPVAIDNLFHKKFLHALLKKAGSLSIPNFDSASNSFKRKQIEKTYDQVFKLLQSKGSLLLYPAGCLKKGPLEVIGGASGLHKILQNVPDLNVVLVRTTGLWGSSFSRALTGKSPEIGKTFYRGFLILLKNFFFFTPRRKVTVEFEIAPSDFPYHASRLELNKYLEKWYNKEGSEALQLVSYCWWKEDLPSIASPKQEEILTIEAVPLQIREKVQEEIATLADISPGEVKSHQRLAEDLGLDSLDIAQLIVYLKENYGVSNVHNSDLTTVSSVMLFAAHLKSTSLAEDDENEALWHEKKGRPSATTALGENLLDSFFLQCDRMKHFPACVDAVVGEFTYSKLKLGVIALAKVIQTLPGKHVGIMLPSSVLVNMVIFATLLAGKIPVMINWTLGSRNLNAIVEQSKIQVTISSWNFLDRLENVELNGIDEQLILLEDFKKKLNLWKKIKAYVLSLKKTKPLLKNFLTKSIDPNDPAVILFTSGTESLPKGVPLSHHNLLVNQKGAFEAATVQAEDIFLGCLPPFHSFGFSVTGLLPLIFGIPVAYSPNPTDGRKIAQAIEKWKASLFCIAPTFLRTLLRVANKKQLNTLRLIVVGSEKMPKDLYDKAAEICPHAEIIEGYGITECAPILTLNHPGKSPRNVGMGGVGFPLPNVKLMIIHPETSQILSFLEQGLILAMGENIFNGYLDPNLPSPFIEIENIKWYKTGDLGYLDKDGYLTLSGRLKRFVKIGGEMVSLAAIEDTLNQICIAKNWHSQNNGPALAVSAIEEEGKKGEIILFTTFSITLDEVNKELREKGMSNLIRVGKIYEVAHIPLLGTGKIDYKSLSSTKKNSVD